MNLDKKSGDQDKKSPSKKDDKKDDKKNNKKT